MKNVRTLQNAWGLLFMRVAAASMLFAGHGFDKIMHLDDRAAGFPDPLGFGPAVSLVLAIFAEGFCSLLVAVGLFARLATVPIITTMLTAALVVHAEDGWHKQEFALLYAVPFLTILLMGPGRYSLDFLRERRAYLTVRTRLAT